MSHRPAGPRCPLAAQHDLALVRQAAHDLQDLLLLRFHFGALRLDPIPAIPDHPASPSLAGLADPVRVRWLALARGPFQATGRMMEKYDVPDPDRPAGGGEYPTQDGFGWTNGVYVKLWQLLQAHPGGRRSLACAHCRRP